MKILLVSSGEKGHVNPLVGVALALRERRAEVAWLCVPETVPQIAALDVEAIGWGAPGGEALITSGAELARLVRDEATLSGWIRQLLLDAVPDQVETFRRHYREVRPDRLILDPMQYGAIIAAHLEGLPWLGVSSSLNPVTPADWDAPLTRMLNGLASERSALFARYGLQPQFAVADCLSPWATAVFATDAYVDTPLPAGTVLVGPSRVHGRRADEVPFPWERLDSRPLLYVSFGSQISWQPEVFGAIAEAAATLGVQMVVTCGDLASGWDGPPAVAVRYAPQLELLPRCRLFVTHGGANSVMEALTAAVPMVVAPVCNDQFLQARFIERRGVGVVVQPYELAAAGWQQVLAPLLNEHPCRQAAAEVAASYRTQNGSQRVADMVLS